MTSVDCSFDTKILEACKQAFIADIKKAIARSVFTEELNVLDNFTAINGAAGVAFIDGINRNSSMGFPWCHGKKYHLKSIAATSTAADPVVFEQSVMERIAQIEENYRLGKRCHPIFRATLKDEATSFAKIEVGKTRVFTAAPADWTIVVRKHFLTMIRLIQNNSFIFESGPGTTCQSYKWTLMYQYLTQHGSDRMVAGDFKGFDKSMIATIIQAAFEIMIELNEYSGKFTDDDIRTQHGIKLDTAFPWVDFNGDLMEFFGSNPSGHPLTVIINGLANSLYMRYAYYEANPEKTCVDFKENVSLMTYGDDNVMGVSKKISFFHHTAIRDQLVKVGVVYTMAEKTAKSVPFIHIDNVSFLKRSWRWDSDVKAFLCPLEHDSIEKSLMTWVRSKSISEEEQCVAVVASAVSEYWFYGRNVFEKRRALLMQIIKDLGYERWCSESTFPTWCELQQRFWETSRYPRNGGVSAPPAL